MSSLRTLVELALEENRHGDPTEIAALILENVDTEALIELVAHYVATYQRELTRRSERQALIRLQPVGTAIDRRSETANLRRLEGAKFTIASRLAVAWLDASVDDHKARIAYLLSKRKGIDDTIGLHRKAIDRIVATGVTCLRDLQDRELTSTSARELNAAAELPDRTADLIEPASPRKDPS